jgi:hypothetical protein
MWGFLSLIQPFLGIVHAPSIGISQNSSSPPKKQAVAVGPQMVAGEHRGPFVWLGKVKAIHH